MELQTILIWAGVAVLAYMILCVVEKLLIKRRAKKVMKDDNGTGTNADRVDGNK